LISSTGIEKFSLKNMFRTALGPYTTSSHEGTGASFLETGRSAKLTAYLHLVLKVGITN
jgi:hypothetical protein